MALSVEVAELNELMQWKTQQESFELPITKIAHELADIFIYTLILCNKFGLDPEQIITDKIRLNDKKYPNGETEAPHNL
jgi:NTP pyrophosphatase (non-canonical NTP hydrolase)